MHNYLHNLNKLFAKKFKIIAYYAGVCFLNINEFKFIVTNNIDWCSICAMHQTICNAGMTTDTTTSSRNKPSCDTWNVGYRELASDVNSSLIGRKLCIRLSRNLKLPFHI